MPELPRTRCPACRADVAIRRGGQLREHPDHRHELYGVGGAVREGRVPQCPAAGLTPEQFNELAQRDTKAAIADAVQRYGL